MITFHVPDMNCGHCVATITQALQRTDAQARVSIDLPARRVQIEAPDDRAPRFAEAIRDAGFDVAPAA